MRISFPQTLASLRRILRPTWDSFVVHATVMTLVVSAIVVPPTVSAAASAPPQRATAAATPGAGPVSRPLPASATPNHGYPKGQRPPVVPPGAPAAGPQRILSKQEWERATTRSAGITQAEGAINLILRPGFDFTGTSLVLYFDAAEPGISGWQSWFATVFDPVSGAAQQSRVMQPSPRWRTTRPQISRSDRQGESGERRSDPPPGWDVESEFVLSAAQVVDEGMSGDDHLGCSIGAQPAHRFEAFFELTVVGLDRIAGVRFDVVPRRGDQFVERFRVDRGGGGAFPRRSVDVIMTWWPH